MTEVNRRRLLAAAAAGLLAALLLLLLLAPATLAPRRGATADPAGSRGIGTAAASNPVRIRRSAAGNGVWKTVDLFTGRGGAAPALESLNGAGRRSAAGRFGLRTVSWDSHRRDGGRANARALIAVRPCEQTSDGPEPPVISAYSPGSDLVIADGESLRFEADCWEPGGGDLTCDWRLDGRPEPSAGAVYEFTPSAATGEHLVELTVAGPGGTASVAWLLEPAAAEQADYPPIVRGTVTNVAFDESGNRYLVGYFTGTGVDFDPTSGDDQHDSEGGDDVFVTRFDANGDYAWTQTFGGTGNDYGADLLVYGGSVYAVGYFSSTDAGVGGTGTLSATGGIDCFVLALDATDGSAVTAFSTDGVQIFGGSTADDYAYGVAADDGVLYVTGSLASTNAGVGGTGSIGPAGGSDCFVLALDSTDGSAETAFGGDGVKTFGGTGDDEGRGVAVAGSTVYVTGGFAGSDAGFDGSDDGITSSGGTDCFVLALSETDGSALTAFDTDGVQIFGGGNDDFGRDIVAYAGDVFVTGELNSTDAGIGGTGSVSTAGGADCFVLALDAADGGSSGVQTFGGTGTDSGFSVAASGGVVYAVGRFDSDDAGIGGAAGVDAEATDCFLMALGTSSNAQGLQLFGGTSDDEGRGVAVFGGTVLFGGNTQSTNARHNGAGTTYDGSVWGGFMMGTGTFDPGDDDDDGSTSGCALAGGADPAAWLLPYAGMALAWVLGRKRKR